MMIKLKGFAMGRFEYIIVGSGPGGAVAAYHLAKAGKDVLILEEGQEISPDQCRPYGLEDMVTKYRNSGLTVMMGRPKVSYVEGRIVGGGSEVNSGLYHRTPFEILEKWQKEYQVQGLEPSGLEPFYKDCEDMTHVSLLST